LTSFEDFFEYYKHHCDSKEYEYRVKHYLSFENCSLDQFYCIRCFVCLSSNLSICLNSSLKHFSLVLNIASNSPMDVFILVHSQFLLKKLVILPLNFNISSYVVCILLGGHHTEKCIKIFFVFFDFLLEPC
jgi:hypothetical protein